MVYFIAKLKDLKLLIEEVQIEDNKNSRQSAKNEFEILGDVYSNGEF